MEDRNSAINLHEFSTADHDLFSNNFSSDETENELLILYIDIGDGVQENLVIHDNDNIEDIAHNFCDKHELGPKAQSFLIEEIEKNLHSLYNQSLSRIPECSQQNISINNSLKMEISNKGCELYFRGQKMRQNIENKRQRNKKEEEYNEMKHTTFKPLTNSPDKRSKPPEKLLLEKGRQTVEMLQKKRIENEKKILDECTFSPEVNKKSINMKRSQMRSPDRYKSLYQDAQSIQEKIIKKTQAL